MITQRLRESFTLLEVVASLVLLAALGVTILRIQAEALRQCRLAENQVDLAQRVEALLESWSQDGVAVTLPSTGRLNELLTWRREAGPIAIGPGWLGTHVLVVIESTSPSGEKSDVYRVDWLVPRKPRSSGGNRTRDDKPGVRP